MKKLIKKFTAGAFGNIGEYLGIISEIQIEKKKINSIFGLRNREFFKKKKPFVDNYPFSIIDPYDIFGEENIVGIFSLVGESWRDEVIKKPVAILWGFNNWKWGFVSDYLKNYRTAFAPRKIIALRSLAALKSFPLKPDVFVFWGYTEPPLVAWYAKLMGIKVLRMEDGFLRSAKLGASHSTPYSLVIDTAGLYYDPKSESNIENILNTHEFDEGEIAAAESAMELMKRLRLSKYNHPTIREKNSSIVKTRRRIAVLGQVDSDVSIKLGNVEKWSMVELIRLAKIENPDADIFYRPHPDVYEGYQNSKFRKRSVQGICEISSPNTPLIDFLESIDHVYTITSLSGLEALILGKKVTVVGAAFYAGWGLTDDRVAFPRRKRVRSLVELFSAVYLKYPKYLADAEDSLNGFYSSALRIKADKEIGEYESYAKQKPEVPIELRNIVGSPYWPKLFFGNSGYSGALSGGELERIDFKSTLGVDAGHFYQIFYIYAICGLPISNEFREKFLNSVRNYIHPNILNSLLLDLNKKYPGEFISKQLSWLLNEVGDRVNSRKILEDGFEDSRKAALNRISLEHDAGSDESLNNKKIEFEYHRITSAQADTLLELFELNIEQRNFGEAVEIAKVLLLDNYFVGRINQRFAQIADLKFDYNSVRGLACLSQCIDLFANNRMMALRLARGFTAEDVRKDSLGFSLILSKLVALKPDKINDAVFLFEKYSDYIEDEKLKKALISSLGLSKERSIRNAQGLIAIEESTAAVRMLEEIIRQGEDSEMLRITYSQALAFSGRVDEALEMMKLTLKKYKTAASFGEVLRLLVLVGNYPMSLEVLAEAKRLKIDLGDMHPRKSYFGARLIREAFETFKDLSIASAVKTYYGNKYFIYGNSCAVSNNLLLVSIFGPGDEIRFASIYNMLRGKLVQENIKITCEPRLKSLFDRSFKNIDFIGVPRPRDSDLIDLENYSNVPGSDLIRVINNDAHSAIEDSDDVLLVTDMLCECLTDYQDFPGTPYLIHDDDKRKAFSDRFPKNVPLVGLSWRSSLTTHSRNEHYLTIEELEPLFSIPGVQFVNFQYDECQDELDWVEARYPGKLINFYDVDHYNDFDGVAALMKCMDLMIAPATTVVELAGALGCPTWMISNSSELHWRKIDAEGTDVWHNSIKHVEGTLLGNKRSLVDQIVSKLKSFIN